MGVTSTLRFFHKEFVDRPLKESTIRTWATKYKKELALRSKFSMEMKVTKLESEEGTLHCFWEELDAQVQEYVTTLRENGGQQL